MSHRLNPSRQGDWLVLVGPYDADLVERLKEVVPSSHREWRPVAKCWRIRPEYEAAVRELIEVVVDVHPDSPMAHLLKTGELPGAEG